MDNTPLAVFNTEKEGIIHMEINGYDYVTHSVRELPHYIYNDQEI